jgi:co-chaperonin GroES (HSP10)
MLNPVKVENIQALNDHVLVADMNFGARTTSSGIHLLGDDMRTAGIRPRWAQVYAVGPQQQDIEMGQWILITHGRWTRGVDIEDQTGTRTIRRIDTDDILLVSDTQPADDSLSTSTLVDNKERW